MTDPFPGGFDPRMFQNVPLFRELAKVMSWQGGPVNWDLAGQTAAAIAVPSGDTPQPQEATEQLVDAVRVVELWLDEVTGLPSVDGPVRALSRGEWVRQATTSSGLGVYVEPIAEGMGQALGRGMGDAGLGGMGLPEAMTGPGGPMAQAMGAMGAMLYGVQVGTIAGHLAEQLLGGYDLGVPTLEPRVVSTVGDHARRFASDYGFDATEFRYWLAVREAAHRREFAGVSWLRGHVADLIRSFAADAEFDPGTMLEQLGGMGLDPNDPEALRDALQRPDAFRVEPTTAQKATLERLQALVAFVEAWSDTVVRAAAGSRLTALPRIEEVVRRRRAEKGEGERFLEQMIGLDLKPSDFRLGRTFCEAVIAARGQEGLDRVWASPAYLPSHAELTEPSRWLVRMAAVELETELGDRPPGD